MRAGSRPWPARLPFYYGWVVVAVAFVTMAIAVNVRTSYSLLFPPILDEFGWRRGVTAGAFSVGFVASVGLAPLVGLLMDRAGPRLVIPLAAAVVAAGLFAATAVSSPLGVYLTLGLLVVGGSIAISYMGHSMFLPGWFVRRRGLAVGIAFSGVGVGAIVILPWLQTLIATWGWRAACVALGVALVSVVIPLNLLLQRHRPETLGLAPDGVSPDGAAPAAAAAPDPVVDRAWADTAWTLATAARTARFWWIFAGYFTGLFAWYSVQVHQTKYLVDNGFGADLAATALGLVGLFGIAGQIGIGALSDRIGREWGWTIAMAGYAACYLALVLLGLSPSTGLVYVVVVAQGLLGYGLASIYGVISIDIFGGLRFATIFSVLSLGGSFGAAAGPWLTGLMFDRSGSYLGAFSLCLAISVLSIACMWLASPGKVRLVPGRAARRARAPGR